MKNKNVVMVFLFLVIIVLMAVFGKKNSGDKLGKINLDATDLTTKEKVGNEILDKRINILLVWQIGSEKCDEFELVINDIYKKYPEINFIGLAVAESSENLLKDQEVKKIGYKSYRLTDLFMESYKDEIYATPTLLYLDRSARKIVESDSELEGIKKEDIERFIVEKINLLNEKAR